MPVPLLLAMVLAFGLGLPTESQPLTPGDLWIRIVQAVAGALLVGLIAAIFGRLVAFRVARSGSSSQRARTLFVWGMRTVVAVGLLVFGWTMWRLDWLRVVDWGLHLRGIALVEEAVVLLPYVLGQFLAWCGLYRAEKALRPSLSGVKFGRYLTRKTRQTLGMVVPAAVIYVLVRDLLFSRFPEGIDDPRVQFASAAMLGVSIFLLSPLFVRLTWPTRRMEPGPLRDRLERLSRRLKFRCSDILVWDTGGAVVNAGVTGAVPWFRYVLITDAMIDLLDDHEIEAVFGHEVGHIAHRHLPYFGLFFLGSTGLTTLTGTLVETRFQLDQRILGLFSDPLAAEIAAGALALAGLGLYFFFVFGYLSRRFERQADVFGARAVSCGHIACPPHADPNAPGAPEPPSSDLCPVGIRIFANALSNVAALNGMPPSARSWRHGSISRRIAFLEALEHSPEAAHLFQRRLQILRWGLAVALGIASGIAFLLVKSGSGSL